MERQMSVIFGANTSMLGGDFWNDKSFEAICEFIKDKITLMDGLS